MAGRGHWFPAAFPDAASSPEGLQRQEFILGIIFIKCLMHLEERMFQGPGTHQGGCSYELVAGDSWKWMVLVPRRHSEVKMILKSTPESFWVPRGVSVLRMSLLDVFHSPGGSFGSGFYHPAPSGAAASSLRGGSPTATAPGLVLSSINIISSIWQGLRGTMRPSRYLLVTGELIFFCQ